MTELFEKIAIGTMKEGNTKCPFDHSNDTPPKVDNDFIGDGGKLGKSLDNGSSTLLYPSKQIVPSTDYPETDKEYPIKIDGHDYPVTCAAHHLIPAQESLKKVTSLHTWMVKKNKPEPLAGGKKAKGKVWTDVGYDVNGAENGIWLPGNYAVGGGTGGTGEWTGATSALADNEQASVRPRKPRPNSRKLTGLRHQVNDDNRKWQYVKQATKEFKCQFHDRHADYSGFVVRILQKIATCYLERKKNSETDCPDCKKRMKKYEELGIPTPFGLASRLNGVSKRLRSYLTNKRGHNQVYTSNWGKVAAIQGKASFRGE